MAGTVKWTESGMIADTIVRNFVSEYHRGAIGLKNASELYFDLVEKQAWSQLKESSKRSISYLEFLTKPVIDGGLETTLEEFDRYFKDNDEVIKRHNELISQGKGGNRGNQYTTANGDNVTIATGKWDITDRGNSRIYAIEYLESHGREDLAQEVMQKKKSANKAMIEAGFRIPTNTVKRTPEDYVRIINKLFSAEQRRWIASEILQ